MERFFSNNSGERPWFRLGKLDVSTTVLVILVALVSMVIWAIDRTILDWLVLYASSVRQGEVWRIATWPMANAPDVWAIIGLVVFFLFGREIESRIGRNRFLAFLAIVTVVSGAVATLVGIEGVATLRMLTTATFFVFVMIEPTARSWFEIPLWVFGAVFLAIEVLQYVGVRAWDLLLFLAVVLGTSLVLMGPFGLADGLAWVPAALKRPARPAPSSGPARRRGAQRRRGPAEVVPLHRNPSPSELLRQAEIDVLLDKISAHGLDSLTKEERRRLEEHSKRMRRGNS